MATSGAESIPGVTLREAYRFESSDGETMFEGTVFKKLPRRINWEARIDGTSIVEVGETRREAVELAIAAFRQQSRNPRSEPSHSDRIGMRPNAGSATPSVQLRNLYRDISPIEDLTGRGLVDTVRLTTLM